ncbi:anti-sigma factor family protein [Flintibacter sp.]|uniref:anti-sigma factor family protein n=1 Tax=Flintibacter sp. TaxID=1918624 RepID=UPI003D0E36AC|nr:zf-HC2 domain-containing protein [Flintibacter sp.]
MISCEHAWELLSQQLDEPLSPQEKQELEEHLAACPSCRKDKEELEQLDQALRNLGEIQAPADFTQRVMAQVQQTQSKPKVIPLWRRPQVRALAGLAACALLCIGIYRSLPQDGNLSGGMVTSGQGEVSSQSSGTADGSQSDSATQYGLDPAQAPDDGGSDPASVPQPRTADPQPEVESSGTQGSQSSGQTTPDSSVSGFEGQSGEPDAQNKAQPSTTSTQTVLVLYTMPDGVSRLLPSLDEWSVDNKGNVSCTVTSQVLEQLCRILDEEKAEYTVTSTPWTKTCIVRLGESGK